MKSLKAVSRNDIPRLSSFWNEVESGLAQNEYLAPRLTIVKCLVMPTTTMNCELGTGQCLHQDAIASLMCILARFVLESIVANCCCCGSKWIFSWLGEIHSRFYQVVELPLNITFTFFHLKVSHFSPLD